MFGQHYSVLYPIIIQIEKLEQTVQQLQLNLASAHQRHKSEACRLEEQATSLQRQLEQTQTNLHESQCQVNDRDEQIKRGEAEIASCREDIRSKVDQVSSSTRQSQLGQMKSRKKNKSVLCASDPPEAGFYLTVKHVR